MSNSYNTGNSAGQISLQVTTGTAATIHSAIFVKDSAGNKTRIIDSVPADNGAIPATAIGTGVALNGSEALIQTMADFSALPTAVQAEIAADNTAIFKYLVLNYTFDGGTGGSTDYGYDISDCVVSTSGSMASIVKHVSLIP